MLNRTSTASVNRSLQSVAGQNRAVIEDVRPEIDCGRYPIKRIVGEEVTVRAAAFADGHDIVRAALLWRRDGEDWNEVPMESLGQDLWQASFQVNALGGYRYTVEAWVDRFRTWLRDFEKWSAAHQDLTVGLAIGAELVRAASQCAGTADRHRLNQFAELLAGNNSQSAVAAVFDADLQALMDRHPAREHATRYARELGVTVDRERAGFSAWYEMFPRSCTPEPGRHGTLKDCIHRLPYVAAMGFDVLYLPPIHPIGKAFAKGRTTHRRPSRATPAVPGPSAATKAATRRSIPSLARSTIFTNWSQRARSVRHRGGARHGLAMLRRTIPTSNEHPEWFRLRPDGTIQYAENPPKKYQDIYPIDFETEHWRELWDELKSIFSLLDRQGVRIFRVDNPHTKPFGFWEWVIGEVKREHPDVIFLSEAFTRPQVMYELAKLRLHAVVHLFHLAQYKLGADEVFQRADADRGARVLPSQPLA